VGFIREIKKNVHLYILALPGIIFLIIFAYIPMAGHLIAFKDYSFQKGILGSPWAGLKNFKFFFTSPDWLLVTKNTLVLNAYFIIFSMLIAVLSALLINEISGFYIRRISQSVMLFPHFISWMAVSLMAFSMLNTNDGLINRMLMNFGKHGVSWYSSPQYWPFILTFMYVWKRSGYLCVIFLAAITSLSTEYYESAEIDGASKFQQIVHITLPLIRPTILVMLLLAVGRIFYGDFGMIYSIVGDNGTLYPTTDVIDTYTFRALRRIGNFSMASAVVLYQSLLGMVTVILFNWIARRVEEDSRLF